MDNAFERLIDLLNDDTIELLEAETAQLEIDIRQMEPPEMIVDVRPVPVLEYDEDYNVLGLINRELFKNETAFSDLPLFTDPISTTNTMEGYLSNVSFHERDLIDELMPDENIVVYRCNYGKMQYELYTEPVRLRKTNRGRKKKEKKKKLRKKQGSGIDFNSQITFVVRSELVEVVDGIVPADSKVYKFKIFRTGKLQLPGVHQRLIDDVIVGVEKIARVLNFHLHTGEKDPAKLTQIVNINPVMKNYKFMLKIPSGKILDMEELKNILKNEKALPTCEHPGIFMVKYTRQDTKLSIKFATPIYKKPKKMTRINIFMRGKINVLGAFDINTTREICEYLHKIFIENYDLLVVSEGFADYEPVQDWEQNIADPTDEEVAMLLAKWDSWLPPLPEFTAAECVEMLEFIDICYNELDI